MTKSDKHSMHTKRILLCFAVALAAILYVDRVCISQLQHIISKELGLSKKQMGLALTTFGVAYGLFEIPGGWLADRFGPRRVLTAGVTWWSFFTLATGWVRSLVSLVSCRFLFGSVGFVWAILFWRWFRDYPKAPPVSRIPSRQ
jgi:MFS family permease